MEEHKENDEPQVEPSESVEEEKVVEKKPEEINICIIRSGKLGTIKKLRWPEKLGELHHGGKLIFEDSYGTDWGTFLSEGNLLEDINDSRIDYSEESGPQDIYHRGRPKAKPDMEFDEEELTEDEQVEIAIKGLEGTILRYCTEDDLDKIKKLADLEREAMEICSDRIQSHKLPMKLLATDYRFDRSKVTFHFSAENRVDFRQLVRDLASIFKCRIELHQIGIRDEAKLYAGFGPCGEKLCCQRHLTRFKSVSIRMARLQNLPLNPAKISGNCGRLMCCLNYECETYAELSKLLPNIGEDREIDGKRCTVVFVSPLAEKITLLVKDEVGKKFTISREEYNEGRTRGKMKRGT